MAAPEGVVKQVTAQCLLDLLLEHSSEQNEILHKLAGTEPDAEYYRIKLMIGHIMASMYSDAIHPILSEHPDLTPPELRKTR